jgi:pyridoxamine 5'-phosphate oxidase
VNRLHSLTPLITGPLADETWGRLVDAANDRSHPMHLMVMATAGVDNRPAARLMTVRGASQELNKVWFHTDRRSPKAAELRGNPYLSLVAFDPRDGVELRLNGRAEIIESGPEADRHWHQAALIIQHLYSSPAAPGEPAAPPDPALLAPQESLSEALTRRARANFAVIEVTVDSIDWFQIIEARSARAILRSSRGWRTEYVTVTS